MAVTTDVVVGEYGARESEEQCEAFVAVVESVEEVAIEVENQPPQ